MDRPTLEYLQQLWKTSGASGCGVFLPRSGFPAVWLGILLGIVTLGAAVILTNPEWRDYQDPHSQAFLAGAGALLLVAGVWRLRARASGLGRFWYVDAKYLWEVSPGRVEATPLAGLRDCRIEHNYRDGVYEGTTLTLQLPGWAVQRRIANKEKAEELARFLKALGLLQGEHGPGLAFDPALLGPLAVHLARGKHLGDTISSATAIPEPTPRSLPVVVWFCRWLAAPVAGAAVAALGLLLFPLLSDWAWERHLFAQTSAGHHAALSAAEAYLREFPDGRRSDEVRARRDDGLYEQARAEAAARRTSAPLRNYLADQRNSRHRQEAEQAIARQEQQLFENAAAAADLGSIDAYLAEFPEKWRAAEVRTLRDDRVFAGAAEKAKKTDDLAGLHAYLAEPRHTRHRQEAAVLLEDSLFTRAREEATTRHRVDKVRVYLADQRHQRHRGEAQKLIKASEKHLFDRITEKEDELGPLDAYLAEFPEGERAAEVLALRDDRVFAQAADMAKKADDPAGLRAYLSDKRNTRHHKESQALIEDCIFQQARVEAKKQMSPAPLRAYLKGGGAGRHVPAAKAEIADHYDRAIGRLKDLSKGKKVDEKLFQVLVALLDGLKGSDTPVVKAGFQAKHDSLPKTELQKVMEKLSHQQYEKQFKAVKTMAEQSPDKSAILPIGGAFDADQTARRERLILELLRRSLGHVLTEDLMKLEFAAEGEDAAIGMAYHTFTDGMLYMYTDGEDTATKVHGLVRGYEVNWTLTITPGGDAKGAHAYKFHSRPALKLSYRRQPNDPTWGCYAVILHSGCYEMSSVLTQKLGLPAPLTPRSFSFLDAMDKLRFGVIILSEDGELKEKGGEVAYSVRLEAGKTYRIDAESGRFDTFLKLEGPGGEVVARDDDSGGNLNARILHRATETGTYLVIVSSFNPDGKGRFLLTVQY